MFSSLRQRCQRTRSGRHATALMIAMTFMLLLGNAMSPVMAGVTADTVAARAASIDAQQQRDDLNTSASLGQAKQIQPLETEVPSQEATEIPTETLVATETEVASEEATEEIVPTDTSGLQPAEFHINLYWCGSTTSFAGVTQGNLLKSECNEQGPQVKVNLTSNTNSVPPMSDSVMSFPGSVSFGPLNADDWKIDFQTAAPVTEDLFFCNGLTPYGNTKPYAQYARLSAGSPIFGMDTLSEEVITCDWFGQIPVTPSGTATTAETPVSVTIYKWECPSGLDTTSTDPDYFSGECDTQQAGVPFHLTDANQTIDTTSDIDGRQIDNLVPNAAGQIGIQEDTPDGFTQPVVFCQDLNANAPTHMTVMSGSISLQTVANEASYQCFWYNIPASDVSVTIYKWECPSGLDTTSTDPAYFSGECDTQQAGVPFHLTDANQTIDTTSDIDGRQIDNLVPDATGRIVIEEDIPAGFTQPVVFCQDLNANAPTQMIVVAGGVSLQTIANEISYQCFWYNIPTGQTGNGDVHVYKYECTIAAPMGADAQWYMGNCTSLMNGVTFVLDTPNVAIQTDTGDTGADGFVMMGGVETGTYPLTETVPAGYEVAAVYCTYQPVTDNSTPGAGAYTQQNVAAGSITATVQDDMRLRCNWYNYSGTPGFSLTIYKWECPAGTTLSNPDPNYYSGECATEMAGVPFDITDGSGTQSTTSDTNGRQIDNLVADANGQILIQETIPSGYQNPVVFCQLLNDPQSTQYPAAGGLVTLPASGITDDYQCFWYNIPMHDNTVHVTKWECPEGTAQNSTIDVLQNTCITRVEGVDFSLTSTTGTVTQATDLDGETQFFPVASGAITLSESIGSGYSPYPIVVCSGSVILSGGGIGDMFPAIVTAPGGVWNFDMSSGQWNIHCDYFNIKEDPSTVIIYKWACPEGVEPQSTVQWHQDNCVTPMDGVEFTLTDTVGPRSLTTLAGMATFSDVATGPIQIRETLPTGYSSQPFLVCQFTYADGSGTGQYSPTPVNGVYNTTIDQPGSEFRCDWYNHPVGPGEITVYKWTCPEGYDRMAWGANPMADCTQATNGITFRLIQPAPNVDLQSNTGDSVNGAVYFGGLEPGTYILNEILSGQQAAGMKEVFVWQCYGLTTSSVQPYPLNVGQMFQFNIMGGDHIVCHWFNVPMDPHGWMDVSKFNCTTEKYVADVYCYTNQTGQEFNLQKWDGNTWTTIMSGKTDVNGKLSFTGLNEGDYRLVEPDKEACLMKSSNITPDKNLGVKNGEGTTVHVYNCKTPPPPTKTPTKYPNTGVDPSGSMKQQRTPALEIAGLLGLAGASMSRRRFLQRASSLSFGAGALALSAAAAQELQPMDSTPAPATPGANIFGCGTPTAATAEALTSGTPDLVDQCARGAVPLHFRIPIIGVDASVEYLEIIDGQMQPPTGATDVTWYKETSRLGEVGNGIYAGHLNYWGIPEGVFFRLESLTEGDVIEIDGDDAQTHFYVVEWTQNFPSDEEPPEEALGTTDVKAITVITCGGEWVPDRAEYDHRTLVRAVLQEDAI